MSKIFGIKVANAADYLPSKEIDNNGIPFRYTKTLNRASGLGTNVEFTNFPHLNLVKREVVKPDGRSNETYYVDGILNNTIFKQEGQPDFALEEMRGVYTNKLFGVSVPKKLYRKLMSTDGKTVLGYWAIDSELNEYGERTYVTFHEVNHGALVHKVEIMSKEVKLESYYQKGELVEVCKKINGVCVDVKRKFSEDAIASVNKRLKKAFANLSVEEKAIMKNILVEENIIGNFVKIMKF